MSRTVRLGSSEMIDAPGIVAWVINGYAFAEDRWALRHVLGAWQHGMSFDELDGLLSGRIPYAVDGTTVVIELPPEDTDEPDQELIDYLYGKKAEPCES